MTIKRFMCGMWWRCEQPGHWQSMNPKGLDMWHTMQGTQAAQWEIYRTVRDGDGTCDELLVAELTMGEALRALVRHSVGSLIREDSTDDD